MSLPDQMTDRWQNRPEPAPCEGVVSWHRLMRDYPEVVDPARQAQQRLAGFDGLHMTPLPWLHMTTLLAGPPTDPDLLGAGRCDRSPLTVAAQGSRRTYVGSPSRFSADPNSRPAKPAAVPVVCTRSACSRTPDGAPGHRRACRSEGPH